MSAKFSWPFIFVKPPDLLKNCNGEETLLGAWVEYLDIISSRNLLLEVHTHSSINLWSCINFYRSNRISISWDRRENRFPCWPRKWCQEPQRHLPKVLVASQLAYMIVWCPKTSKMVVGQLRHHTTCRPVSDNELWCSRIPWLFGDMMPLWWGVYGESPYYFITYICTF